MKQMDVIDQNDCSVTLGEGKQLLGRHDIQRQGFFDQDGDALPDRRAGNFRMTVRRRRDYHAVKIGRRNHVAPIQGYFAGRFDP
ncbi:MAG: hypothetical protein WD407_13510 [Rhodospirillales bacterium]